MLPLSTPTRSQTGTSTPGPSRPTSPPTTSRLTPAGGAAGGKTDRDEQRRARREQLRSFYGIDSATPSAPPTPARAVGGGEGGDAQGIEGEGFDAAGYYQEMIANSTLEELMKRAVTLTAEIGDLQSSRHSLVYNHHHKLFSAGDAIQVLNTRTPQLISIVTSLQDSFSSISQLADSVALPDLDPDAVEVDPADERVRGAEKALERMRLMRAAELPLEDIRAVYGRLESDMEKAAEGGDARTTRILQEGRQLAGIEESETS